MKILGNNKKCSKIQYLKSDKEISKVFFITIFFIILFFNSFSQISNINSFGNRIKKNYLEYAIPVGSLDLDEDLRNLQLLNKFKSNNSFTIRPIYTNYEFSYDSILNNIDTGVYFTVFNRNPKKINFNLIPFTILQKHTTDHPYGWNDGALKNAKGYQMLMNTGFNLNYRNLILNISPEFVYTENAKYQTPYFTPVQKNYLGNSFLFYNIKNLNIGVSNQNLWWGPGIYNSLIMSNNAPGFLHYNFSTNKPINTIFGTFEFQLIGGKLTRDLTQGLENKGMNKPDSLNGYFSYVKDYTQFNERYINGIAISYNPKFFKNLYLGINRIFMNYARESIPDNFIENYLPVFALFTVKDYEDKINRDQILSINARWLFPKNNAEIYIEGGFNDAFANIRDFQLDLEHASAYIFGVKKIDYISEYKYLTYNIEITRLTQTPSYIHRNAGYWYQNSQILEGYTNDNQIIGSGGGIGNNIQTFSFGYNNNDFRVNIKLQHIAQNPNRIYDSGNGNNGLGDIKWNDYLIGMNLRKRWQKFICKYSIDFIKSKNYNYIDNLTKFNIVNNLSIMYLW